MGRDTTGYDAYDTLVNGYKVIDTDDDTATLENGIKINRRDLIFLGTDFRRGINHYRHDLLDDKIRTSLLPGEAYIHDAGVMTSREWASAVLRTVADRTNYDSYPQDLSAFDLGRALGRALANSNESEHIMLLAVEVLRGIQHYKNVKESNG